MENENLKDFAQASKTFYEGADKGSFDQNPEAKRDTLMKEGEEESPDD